MSDVELLFSDHDGNTLVEVWQQGQQRWLKFDQAVTQSAFLLDKPHELILPLQHYLLAGCLFVEQPRKVLLAGLGGGDMLRYFGQRFPETRIEAVEQSSLICDLARDWFQINAQAHDPVHCLDIRDFLGQGEHDQDLIVVDIAEGSVTPEWLTGLTFLKQLKNALSPQGHVAFNLLVTDAQSFKTALAAIRQVFNRLTVCSALPGYDNVLVYAFNQPPAFPVQQVAARARQLQSVWALDFPEFYRQMCLANPQGSGIF